MEQATDPQLLLLEGLTTIGIPLDPEQIHLFMLYLKQLKLWNRSFNLTAITRDEDIIIKHFIDSLAALRAVKIDLGSRLLDVGTGAGFPGIPFKIVRRDLEITLIEPAHKKSSFLHFIIGLLQLPKIDVFSGTLDVFRKKSNPPPLYDYITSRALNSDLLFQHGKSLLREGGRAILYSARGSDKPTLSSKWHLVNEYAFELPRSSGTRMISIFSPSY